MSRSLTSAKVKTQRKPAKRGLNGSSAADVVKLEALSPDQAAALNAFYKNRAAADIEIAGQPAKIAAAWPRAQMDDQPPCVLRARVGDHTAELHVPLSLVGQVLATVEPTARLENLLPPHAALLLEAALAYELDWLEAKLQAPMELVTIEEQTPPASISPFNLVLSVDGHAMDCALSLSDGALLARLGALLDEAVSGRPPLPATLPLSVRLWRDVLTINLGEAKGLQPGDVVLFAEQAATVLIIGDKLVAPAGITAAGPQLLAVPVAIAGSKWEWMMGQDTGATGQTLDDATLEDLPIALAFEIGRKTMPLGDVRQLTAGAVVQLDATGQGVDILANGKRVGQGEMVRIGESLGVRVIRMFDNA